MHFDQHFLALHLLDTFGPPIRYWILILKSERQKKKLSLRFTWSILLFILALYVCVSVCVCGNHSFSFKSYSINSRFQFNLYFSHTPNENQFRNVFAKILISIIRVYWNISNFYSENMIALASSENSKAKFINAIHLSL